MFTIKQVLTKMFKATHHHDATGKQRAPVANVALCHLTFCLFVFARRWTGQNLNLRVQSWMWEEPILTHPELHANHSEVRLIQPNYPGYVHRWYPQPPLKMIFFPLELMNFQGHTDGQAHGVMARIGTLPEIVFSPIGPLSLRRQVASSWALVAMVQQCPPLGWQPG